MYTAMMKNSVLKTLITLSELHRERLMNGGKMTGLKSANLLKKYRLTFLL